MLSQESFLELAKASYSKIASIESLDNFYDYEAAFAEEMKELSRKLLESSISDLSADRRKKKHFPNLE